MPLILKNRSDRFAARFGAKAAFRSTSELVDQLQDQLDAERAQHRCAMALKEQELAVALRELAQAHVELARHESISALDPRLKASHFSHSARLAELLISAMLAAAAWTGSLLLIGHPFCEHARSLMNGFRLKSRTAN